MQGLKTKQYKTSSKNYINDIKFKKSGAKDKWSRLVSEKSAATVDKVNQLKTDKYI